MEEIHIGHVIQRVMHEQKSSSTRVAQFIGVHIGSISRIHNQASVQTRQLQLISEAVQYDFFSVFSEKMEYKKVQAQPAENALKADHQKELAEKDRIIADLMKEMAYLKQINELLMKKK